MVVVGGRNANLAKRSPVLGTVPIPVSAPWTITARMDPKRRLMHDFRNTIQELVYAVERADGTAVVGLGNCLEGYLREALYGATRVS